MAINFEAINQQALSCWESLLRLWYVDGRLMGREFKIGSLAGEPGQSLSINVDSGKWADFAQNIGGNDPISFVAAKMRCGQYEAAVELNRHLKADMPVEVKGREPEWTPLDCAPLDAPEPLVRHYHYGVPTGIWRYYTADGKNLIGVVCRYESPKGKQVLPMTWCRSPKGDSEEWRFKAFKRPRPLFNLQRITDHVEAPVLIVEGEKCAEIAQEVFTGAVVTTWPGGAKAIGYVDWEPLRGRRITIWPDNDQAGRDAADCIKDLLVKTECTVRVLIIPDGLPEGWDVADGIQSGWTNARIKQFVRDGVDPEAPKFDAPALKVEAEPEFDAEEIPDIYEEEPEPFRILGQADGNYYYLPRDTQSITMLTTREHTKLELLGLASASYWERTFPSKNGADWFAAANSLIQRAKRNDYDPSLIRGRGAWLDDGRVVFHRGNSLLVDGIERSLGEHSSRWTYNKGRALQIEMNDPLRPQETRRLIDLIQCFQFRNQLDHALLSGWLALAPICGAIEWRPHIWLTGPAGSGKTWILENIVRPVLGNTGLYVQSVTTEAGIRQMLGCDALPVVFDEAEAERDIDQRRMQAVLMLARQASRESDGRIAKGTASGQAMTWHVRSMFMFSSIGIAATQRADLSRVTVLDLLPEHQRKVDRFQEALAIWKETLAFPRFVSALRSRSIHLAATIAANAVVFKTAVLEHLGNQRDADQIGSLLAGAYSLTSSGMITSSKAAEWCVKQDWSTYKGAEFGKDESHCLHHLWEANLVVDLNEGGPVRTTVAELLVRSYDGNWGSNRSEHARQALARIGIGVRKDGIDIANAHNELKKIFTDTPWNEKWKDQLRRIDGSTDQPCTPINGVGKRAVRLPLRLVPMQME